MKQKKETNRKRTESIRQDWCNEYASLNQVDNNLLNYWLEEGRGDIFPSLISAPQLADSCHDNALFYPLMTLVDHILRNKERWYGAR